MLAVVFIPVYISYLGIEAYGLIAVFAVLQTLSMLLDFGMGTTINREMSLFMSGKNTTGHIYALLRSMETVIFVMSLLLMLSLWASAGLLVDKWFVIKELPEHDVIVSLKLISLVVMSRFCEGFYRGALYGAGKQLGYNIIFVMQNILRYVGVIFVLAFIENNIIIFFAWQAMISVLSLIAVVYLLYSILPKGSLFVSPSFNILRPVIGYSSGVMVITALTSLMLQVDKVFLSNIIEMSQLGYYSIAAAASGVLFMAIAPVTHAIFPHAVRESGRGSGEFFTADYRLASQVILVCATPLFTIMNQFPEQLLYVWSGDVILSGNTSNVLTVLSLAFYMNGIAYLSVQMMLAAGQTKKLVSTYSFSVMLLVILLYLVVPTHGVMGAANVWLFINSVFYMIVTYFLYEGHMSKLIKYLVDCFKVLVILWAIAYMLSHLLIDIQGRLEQFLMIFCIWLFQTLLVVYMLPEIKNVLAQKTLYRFAGRAV